MLINLPALLAAAPVMSADLMGWCMFALKVCAVIAVVCVITAAMGVQIPAYVWRVGGILLGLAVGLVALQWIFGGG